MVTIYTTRFNTNNSEFRKAAVTWASQWPSWGWWRLTDPSDEEPSGWATVTVTLSMAGPLEQSGHSSDVSAARFSTNHLHACGRDSSGPSTESDV